MNGWGLAAPFRPPTNGSPVNEESLTETDIQLIREDWKAFADAKKQRKVVEDMFLFLFSNYEHIRPIFPFGRKPVENVDELTANPSFQSHVVSFTNMFNNMTVHLHNRKALAHLTTELGLRHFFYDTIEPHYDVLQTAFLHSLQSNRLRNSVWTEQLAEAWRKAFIVAKRGMQQGLMDARFKYLTTAITKTEMVTITQQWEQVKGHGLKESGVLFSNAAVRSYEALASEYRQETGVEFAQRVDKTLLSKFATDAMMALNVAVRTYNEDIGFAALPNALESFAKEYYFTNASPALVRKALMEALMNMLAYTVGEVSMTESVQRTWMKLYRMVEQSIVVSILNART